MAEPNIGVLDQRVTGLEHGFKDLNTALTHLSTRIDDKFGNLGTLISERSRTNWPIFISMGSLLFMIISALGFLTLQPLKDRQFDFVEIIKELRLNQVPRSEHVERWRSFDKDIENVRNRIIYESTNLEKSIDDIRKKVNDTYSARDVLLELRERLARLELEYAKK